MRREKSSKKTVCLVIALCLLVCTLMIPEQASATVVQGQAGVGQVQGASGYEVYRATARNGKYVKLKEVGPGGWAFFNKKNVAAGTEYFYKVRAFQKTSKGRVYGKYSKILRVNSKLTRSFRVTARYNVNIRKYAGTSYDRLLTVPAGTKMTVLCNARDKAGARWYRVKLKSNKKDYTGYVRSDLVR